MVQSIRDGCKYKYKMWGFFVLHKGKKIACIAEISLHNLLALVIFSLQNKLHLILNELPKNVFHCLIYINDGTIISLLSREGGVMLYFEN